MFEKEWETSGVFSAAEDEHSGSELLNRRCFDRMEIGEGIEKYFLLKEWETFDVSPFEH